MLYLAGGKYRYIVIFFYFFYVLDKIYHQGRMRPKGILVGSFWTCEWTVSCSGVEAEIQWFYDFYISLGIEKHMYDMREGGVGWQW